MAEERTVSSDKNAVPAAQVGTVLREYASDAPTPVEKPDPAVEPTGEVKETGDGA